VFFKFLLNFFENHSQRICFFSGGTRCHPCPDHISFRKFVHQIRQNLFLELFPDILVAKKTCHADQEFFKQDINFFGIFLQKTDIMGKFVYLVNSFASFNSSKQSILFVRRKIVSAMIAKQYNYFFKTVLVFAVHCNICFNRGNIFEERN